VLIFFAIDFPSFKRAALGSPFFSDQDQQKNRPEVVGEKNGYATRKTLTGIFFYVFITNIQYKKHGFSGCFSTLDHRFSPCG